MPPFIFSNINATVAHIVTFFRPGDLCILFGVFPLDSSITFSPQWTGQKKLVLNTGVHHATIERKGASWHLYVMSERRVTISRDVSLDPETRSPKPH